MLWGRAGWAGPLQGEARWSPGLVWATEMPLCGMGGREGEPRPVMTDFLLNNYKYLL